MPERGAANHDKHLDHDIELNVNQQLKLNQYVNLDDLIDIDHSSGVQLWQQRPRSKRGVRRYEFSRTDLCLSGLHRRHGAVLFAELQRIQQRLMCPANDGPGRSYAHRTSH